MFELKNVIMRGIGLLTTEYTTNTELQWASPSQEDSSEMMKITLTAIGLHAEHMQIKSAKELDRLAKLYDNVYNEVAYRM